MRRIIAQSGLALAIAAFAMLLIANCLHSPLHHFAHSHSESSHVDCHDHLHGPGSDVHLAHSHVGHAHSHKEASEQSYKGGASQAGQKSSPSESPAPCPHHHTDDCVICQFLASNTCCVFALCSLEGVDCGTQAVVEIDDFRPIRGTLDHLARGPPLVG